MPDKWDVNWCDGLSPNLIKHKTEKPQNTRTRIILCVYIQRMLNLLVKNSHGDTNGNKIDGDSASNHSMR